MELLNAGNGRLVGFLPGSLPGPPKSTVAALRLEHLVYSTVDLTAPIAFPLTFGCLPHLIMSSVHGIQSLQAGVPGQVAVIVSEVGRAISFLRHVFTSFLVVFPCDMYFQIVG